MATTLKEQTPSNAKVVLSDSSLHQPERRRWADHPRDRFSSVLRDHFCDIRLYNECKTSYRAERFYLINLTTSSLRDRGFRDIQAWRALADSLHAGMNSFNFCSVAGPLPQMSPCRSALCTVRGGDFGVSRSRSQTQLRGFLLRGWRIG